MTKLLKAAALAATMLATTPVLAAGDVLTVDLNRVLSESAAAKNGTAQLKAKYEAQLTTRRTALQGAASTYQSQLQAARAATKPGTQPPPATLQAVQQAGERAQAAQDSFQQLQQELNAVEGYVQQQIVEHVQPIAEQVRNERKAAAVLSKGALLASDPAGDVTSVVIQRLDTAFPTPSITLPQQAPAGPGR